MGVTRASSLSARTLTLTRTPTPTPSLPLTLTLTPTLPLVTRAISLSAGFSSELPTPSPIFLPPRLAADEPCAAGAAPRLSAFSALVTATWYHGLTKAP